MKKIAAITALILALILVLSACGNKLEGKWKGTFLNATFYYEFKGNKVIRTAIDGNTETGTYKTKGDKLIITWDDETTELNYKVSGKTLTLKSEGFGIDLTKQ